MLNFQKTTDFKYSDLELCYILTSIPHHGIKKVTHNF